MRNIFALASVKTVNFAEFEARLALFMAGECGYPLHDHLLTGTMRGKRAFSIANDIRVVYIKTDNKITFIDVGSHNQVYK